MKEGAINLAIQSLLESVKSMIFRTDKIPKPSDKDVIREWEVWTLFLDPVNDSISFYIEQRKGGAWRITDGGRAWAENSIYDVYPKDNIEEIAKSIIGSHLDMKMEDSELYIDFKDFKDLEDHFQVAAIDIISAQLRVYVIGELMKRVKKIDWV
jgi:hypothetical protein